MRISNFSPRWALIATGLVGSLAAAAETSPMLELPTTTFTGRSMADVSKNFAKERDVDAAHQFAGAAFDVLAGAERLCQRFHALGLNYAFGRELPVPFLRLNVGVNPSPSEVHAADVRAVLDEFYQRLEAVDAQLAKMKTGDFKLILPLGAVALDFDGNGAITEGGTFSRLFGQVSRSAPSPNSATGPGTGTAAEMVVAFDRADAAWLRAYTHMLRGLIDLLLAHDGGKLFDATGHLFFLRAVTPLAAKLPAMRAEGRFDEGKIADAIAVLHTLVLPVQDPARLARVRTHLLAMVQYSRETLGAIAAETDNDREWLPGPAQQSALGLTLSAEQADGWRLMLTELEALLEGKKLLPHWRFKDGRGFNVKRFLSESRETDLVLLIQGTAAVPYLEEGPLTDAATWRQIMAIFRGNFLGYALWIN